MTITVLVQRQTMPCIKVSIFETFIQGRKYETGLPKSYDPIYREREKRCLKSYRKLSECRHHMHLGNRWLSQGNFEWAMRTYVGLKALKGRYKNFTLGVHTVISNFNVNDFENIYKFVRDELKPDSFISEIAEERVELDTVGTGITPPIQKYQPIIERLQEGIRQAEIGGI